MINPNVIDELRERDKVFSSLALSKCAVIAHLDMDGVDCLLLMRLIFANMIANKTV